MTTEDKIIYVTARYPDAYARKYASLSIVIWCPLLDCRLSGFFHTEEEAWSDAVLWIAKNKKIPKLNSFDGLKNFVVMKDGSLMDMEEWTSIPHPSALSPITEDAEFEIIEPKQLSNS